MSDLWRLTLVQSVVGTTFQLWRHTKQLYGLTEPKGLKSNKKYETATIGTYEQPNSSGGAKRRNVEIKMIIDELVPNLSRRSDKLRKSLSKSFL